ncbi:MAG: response regulator [Dehalococcoidia bacterium]|nr:response regulator [Dehalococcoidia bacterium]
MRYAKSSAGVLTRADMSPGSVEPGADNTVLVVEDDERIQRLVAIVLRGEGFRVLQAMDGRQALSVVAQDIPGVIILDLMLPVLDGWVLREKLRQDPSTAEIPIVLISAVRNLPQTARDLEVADYLSKPFEIDDLVKAVRRQLEPHRS